jgi:hypothetical protein
MGMSASVPLTTEEALAQGYTEDEISRYVASHPPPQEGEVDGTTSNSSPLSPALLPQRDPALLHDNGGRPLSPGLLPLQASAYRGDHAIAVEAGQDAVVPRDTTQTIIYLPTCKFCFVTSHNLAEVSGSSSIHEEDCPRFLRQQPLLTADGAPVDPHFHDNGGDDGIHDADDDPSIITLPTCKFCLVTSHSEAEVSGPSSIHSDDCPRALPPEPLPKPKPKPSIRYLPDSVFEGREGARGSMYELTRVARAEKEPGALSDLLIQHIGHEGRIPAVMSAPVSRGIVDHLGFGVCAAASIASALNACYEGVEGPDKPEKRFTWQYILYDIIEKHGHIRVRTGSGAPTSARVGNTAILKVCRSFPNIKAGLLLDKSHADDLPSSWSKFRWALEEKRSAVLFHCTNHYCLVQGCTGGHEYKDGESYIFTAGRGQEATVVRSWAHACRIITEKSSGNYRMLRIWYDGP